MKKFISMVMAAAMVVSVVPATAFAADAKATAKVVDSKNLTEAEAAVAEKGYKGPKPTETPTAGIKDAGAAPEVQIKVTSADFTAAELKAGVSTEITLTLDNAEWIEGKSTNVSVFQNAVKITDDDASKASVSGATTGIEAPVAANLKIKDIDDDEVTLVFDQAGKAFEKDDRISIDLSSVVLTKTSAGTKATVAVDSDDLDLATDDMVFVEVKDSGLTASIKKVAEVAEEEITELEKDLKIKTDVSKFEQGQILELKLSGGFKFNTIALTGDNWKLVKDSDHQVDATSTSEYKGESKAYIMITSNKKTDEITIKAAQMKVDADTAKEGAEGKLTVKAVRENNVGFSETAEAVVVAKVVAQNVTVSVDEDEDVPVIYNGVNVNNVGITDDSDHVSLKVTIKEPVADSLDTKKALTMTLPEGVYATDVNVTDVDDWFDKKSDAETAFAAAYKKGEYDNFEFVKRTFSETDPDQNEKGKLEFEMTLVAEPDFTGDVTLTVEGGGLDKAQKVTIAKFVAPYTVEAAQNDLIIDYRNTKVPTNIVVKEAEAGLWDEDLKFTFDIDKLNNFEGDATYKVDDKSEMEVKAAKSGLGFTVDERSGDEAAAVTISDVSLYMDRSLAAGAYDLELLTNAAQFMYVESLFTTEKTDVTSVPSVTIGKDRLAIPVASQATGTYAVADAVDYVDGHDLDVDNVTVKEGFVNVITAGRDQDDASFTKKVVVPVGEKYLIAGEEQVALDVPAYISAAGYTMLPVRAVATALGINNNNVLWNQASRTVTILYGQRIITMVAGQKVVTVNGNTIPASATVQIKDGRTFLPMRDLATALGVTDITWDAATKTATMNGTQK